MPDPEGTEMTERTDDREVLTEKQERNIRAGQSVRIAVLVITGGLLAIWVLSNTDDTEVDWVFAETTSPLIVVMLASAFLGLVFGWFVGRRSGGDE